MIKPIEKSLTRIPNRFLLTSVVSRRWESLVAGAPPLVDVKAGMSRSDVVFAEIVEGRVGLEEGNLRVMLEGQPRIEERDEPMFTGALPTDADDLKHAVGDDAGHHD